MPKDNQKRTTSPKAAEPGSADAGGGVQSIVGGPPKYRPDLTTRTRPSASAEPSVAPPAKSGDYQNIKEQARGPGVAEWRELDQARADLTTFYRELRDDPRYAEEHKAETAWRRYEQAKSRIENLAPEARAKMLKSAETAERQSIPVPEGEHLLTSAHSGDFLWNG